MEYIVKLGCIIDCGDGVVDICVGDTNRVSMGLKGDSDCKAGGWVEGDGCGGQEGASDF